MVLRLSSLSGEVLPDEPTEELWLTVHRDLKRTPRVRALLDFLSAQMKEDTPLFRGRAAHA